MPAPLSFPLPHHLTVAAINFIFAKVATRYAAEHRQAEIAYGEGRGSYRAMRRAGRRATRAWDRVEWARNVEVAS